MLSRIPQWIKSPIFAERQNKTLAANLLNIIIWVFIIGASLYGLTTPIGSDFFIRRIFFIIPFVLVMLGSKQILNWGYIQLTGNLVVISIWTLITSALFYGSRVSKPCLYGVHCCSHLCRSYLRSIRATIGWVFVCIITSAVILQLGVLGFLPRIGFQPLLFRFGQRRRSIS